MESVGQENTQQEAVDKLKKAIESNIHTAPISIEELHEFLMIEYRQNNFKIYELRANKNGMASA